MSAPQADVFVPDPLNWRRVAAPHLGWAECSGCGSGILVTAAFADRGRCGSCPPIEVADAEGPVPSLAEIRPRALDRPVQESGLHPEPIVPRRAATEAELPSAARSIRKLAEAGGWRVWPTYALGWQLDARGKVASLTHSTALRMRKGGNMCVAVWTVKEDAEGLVKLKERGVTEIPPPATGWKFDLAYRWGAGHAIEKLSSEALKVTLGWVKPVKKAKKPETIEGVA